MFESMINTVFSPITALNPLIAIFIISTILTVAISLVNKKMMGSSKADEVKEKMKKIRADLLEAQKSNDKQKVDDQMKKMMGINSEYLQSMIKPLGVSLIISMLLIITIFPWMRAVYNGKVILTMPEFMPLIGGAGLTWIWWYIICSLVVGLLLRKILGI